MLTKTVLITQVLMVHNIKKEAAPWKQRRILTPQRPIVDNRLSWTESALCKDNAPKTHRLQNALSYHVQKQYGKKVRKERDILTRKDSLSAIGYHGQNQHRDKKTHSNI